MRRKGCPARTLMELCDCRHESDVTHVKRPIKKRVEELLKRIASAYNGEVDLQPQNFGSRIISDEVCQDWLEFINYQQVHAARNPFQTSNPKPSILNNKQ